MEKLLTKIKKLFVYVRYLFKINRLGLKVIDRMIAYEIHAFINIFALA